ncbi:MAG: 2-aminoethylphosphonate--pyruvate transaminase [Geminicoccaceae bacterium]
MSSFTRLLTPGPLALAPGIKACMQTDLGSRDGVFRQVTHDIRRMIQTLAGAGPDYTVIPVQGSGTFAIEAALTTFLKPNDKVLVCVNGVYGELVLKILARHGLGYAVVRRPVGEPIPVEEVEARLRADPAITHLYFVHLETTSGILNPLHELVALARRHGVVTMVDSMSAFGAIEIDARSTPFDVMLASGNKCIEAPPGIAFAIVRRSLLTDGSTVARTYSLDLLDQWQGFESTGEWRCTPPTHVAQALHAALRALTQETVAGRRARYAAICSHVVDGMRQLGFTPIVTPELQSPVCVAFRSERLMPDGMAFASYYRCLRAAGLFIYSKFHAESGSFRVGCIGQIRREWVDDLLDETASFVQARALPFPAGNGLDARQQPFAQVAVR